MPRSVENWIETFQNHCDNDVAKIAKFVLGDLVHYTHGRGYESEDQSQLANALTAFAITRSAALGKGRT